MRTHPRSHKQVTCRAGIQTRIKYLRWAILPPITENNPKLENKAKGREHVFPVWLKGPSKTVSPGHALTQLATHY